MTSRRLLYAFSSVLVVLALTILGCGAQTNKSVNDIPKLEFEKFAMPNGLK